jgi:hypothetical protein
MGTLRSSLRLLRGRLRPRGLLVLGLGAALLLLVRLLALFLALLVVVVFLRRQGRDAYAQERSRKDWQSA